jgi:FAD/FMN-containing dehydrogenase
VDAIARLAGWDRFSAGFTGHLLGPSHADYDQQRRIWNGDFDKRPLVIARCACEADVVAAVRFARERDLLVAVRGGGHSYPGHSTCDGGMLIDLGPMKRVTTDPQARSVRIGGGALLRDVDQATAAVGMIMPAGVVSHTGMGGLALGGGFGYASRLHGLTCDNFLRLTVVTADGTVVMASATENPDLFWGLRGGGGNFGIVTEFECRLHPIGPVQSGWLYFPMTQAAEVLELHASLAAGWPRELTVQYVLGTPSVHAFAPVKIDPPQPLLGTKLCYIGDPAHAEQAMRDVRTRIRPLVDTVSTRSYVDVQTEFDAFSVRGIGWYMKSAQTHTLSREAIDTAVSAALELGNERFLLAILSMGGAISDVPEMGSAYSGRDANWHISLEVAFTNPEERARHIAWSRRTHAALQPRLDRKTSYVNMLDDTDISQLETLYGPQKYQRLREVKSKFDPANFFRRNSNIPPLK